MPARSSAATPRRSSSPPSAPAARWSRGARDSTPCADASITVGAETTGDDPSSIPFFDDRGIPTVDSVDLLSGRVALVYALTGAASGNFGVKDTADSLLPDLLTPDEQIAPGAGGGRG